MRHISHERCSTYAIYNADASRLTIRRLPFDFGRYVDEMVAHGVPLPRWLIEHARTISQE